MRLLARELDLPQRCRGTCPTLARRDEDVFVVADADARARLGEAHQLLAVAKVCRARSRPAVRLRWRETSSWRRARRSTAARTRSRPAPTRRRPPPRRGRSARGPTGRAPSSPSAPRPAGRSRRPTSCRRRAREGRPRDRASRRRAWRRAAPARRAPRRRAGRRCARWLRRRPPSSWSSRNVGQPVVGHDRRRPRPAPSIGWHRRRSASPRSLIVAASGGLLQRRSRREREHQRRDARRARLTPGAQPVGDRRSERELRIPSSNQCPRLMLCLMMM